MAARLRLPLISGFLLAGILAGPYLLGFLDEEAVRGLGFFNQIALAFIALSAGAEVHLEEFRERLRSIRFMTLGLVVVTFALTLVAFLLLADVIPFMEGMEPASHLAVALLAGSILVARSPSSAIAIVNELRARGPLTHTVLGVTLIMDVVVILLFSISSSAADALITEHGFSPLLPVLVLAELVVSVGLGCLLGFVLTPFFRGRSPGWFKTAAILGAGWSTYILSGAIRKHTAAEWSFEVLLEPLLICMVGGFTVTNFTRYQSELKHLLNTAGTGIHVVFFTLVGASLALDSLSETWIFALILFGVRLGAIALGTFTGGTLAGDPARFNRIVWMTFVTQAGIGLGLAKEVEVEFAAWGEEFSTMIIAVIIINQLVGPPLFKWALNLAGEAHTRAEGHPEGGRRVYIFGLDAQSLELARQLDQHGWTVCVATRRHDRQEKVPATDADIRPYVSLDADNMRSIGAEGADTIVALLSDEENLMVCRSAYEELGTRNLVVLLHDPRNQERFREFGALIVHPETAIVGLLDHLVRAPAGTSLLMGMEETRDIVELELRNGDLHGLALRDLGLPLDVLVLSVERDGARLVSHGYTRLKVGDRVTAMGSPETLVELALRFES